MANNVQIILSSKEYKDLKAYCELNNFKEDDIIKNSYLQGFRIEKYGLLSSGGTENIKEVIKYVEVPTEVVKEVIKEVPIEIIKEVPSPPQEVVVTKFVDREVIKEVPVEKIVEKIEYVSDNTQINELLHKIQELENKEPEIKEIVKEVIVEKVVNDDKKIGMLSETLQKLKLEISDKNKKIEELEKIILEFEKFKKKSGAVYLRGSNLDETLM